MNTAFLGHSAPLPLCSFGAILDNSSQFSNPAVCPMIRFHPDTNELAQALQPRAQGLRLLSSDARHGSGPPPLINQPYFQRLPRLAPWLSNSQELRTKLRTVLSYYHWLIT